MLIDEVKRSVASPNRRPPFSATRRRGLLVETLETRQLLSADPVINELMASNHTTLFDRNGDSSDWVEIYNPHDTPISLDGWYLTDDDDEPTKWPFPNFELQPGSHLLVFASGKQDPMSEYLMKRDFTSVVDGTFLVDLPDGQYDVRLTLGDLTATSDEMSVWLQGVQVDTKLLATANSFATRVYTATVGPENGGQLALRVVDAGGGTPRAPVNGLVIASQDSGQQWRFDFGPRSGPVEKNYTRVTAGDIYSTEIGYGWRPGDSVQGRDFGQTHASFRLGGGGEYLALVRPDESIAHEYRPRFPSQYFDVSYGLAAVPLFEHDRTATYHVPALADAALGTAWTAAGFDDSAWLADSGVTVADGFGYTREGGENFQHLFETDVANVLSGINSSLWMRQEFEVADPSALGRLLLSTHYDDGFVAFLNGVEVARSNAPASLSWNSAAAAERPPTQTLQVEQIDITEHLSLLTAGTNVLAIQGLNRFPQGSAIPDDVDFLLRMELAGISRDLPGTAFVGYLALPTPGSPNTTGRSAAIVEFDTPSRSFADPFELVLSSANPAAAIHYTLDGSTPNSKSPLYTGPITISSTALVKASVIEPGLAPSPAENRWYANVDASLSSFSSNLPVAVLDNFASGRPGESVFQMNAFRLYEPHPQTGRTQLAGEPALETRAGVRVRGASTAGRDKASYTFETWNERNTEEPVELLGMPADSKWVLYGPLDFDRTLIHNTLMYELSNQLGRYAVKTRFIELYFNMDGGDVSSNDYRGVYALMERITVDPDRVDIVPLEPEDNQEPDVTGGWLLKIDRLDPGDVGFGAARQHIAYVDPSEPFVTLEQTAWIQNHFNAMYASLPNADPQTGYPSFIDVDSWIDHHILNLVPMNVDAFRLSGYFYKNRQGLIEMGPIWDFDRSLESNDGRDNEPKMWSGTGDATRFFEYPWWAELFQQDLFLYAMRSPTGFQARYGVPAAEYDGFDGDGDGDVDFDDLAHYQLPDFAHRYRDRWFELRRGVLSEENLTATIERQASEVAEAAERNAARWSQGRPRLASQSNYKSGKLDGTYRGEIEHMKTWLFERLQWIDSQFVMPPEITPSETSVAEGQPVEISFGGEDSYFEDSIYYTADGSDPRLPGGEISPEAVEFDPHTFYVGPQSNARYLVPSDAAAGSDWLLPGYDDSSWNSSRASLSYDTGIADGPVRLPGGFDVRQVFSTVTVSTLDVADSVLAGENVDHEVVVEDVPVIDYALSFISGNFSQSSPFPDSGSGSFVLEAVATLEMEEAGWITFGVHMDDAARLTVDGVEVLREENLFLPSDRLAGTFLEAGTHELRLVKTQVGFGAVIELYYALGAHDRIPSDAALVGNDATVLSGFGGKNVQDAMQSVNPSLYMRVPFDAVELDRVAGLSLDMQYDDGFVAYLNGVEVARRLAPDTLTHASQATGRRDESEAVRVESIDVTPFLHLLSDTGNVLAIQGLNLSAGDADFLLIPRLNAHFQREELVVDRPLNVMARAWIDGQWGALADARFVPIGTEWDLSHVRVDEIHYNPSAPNAAERAARPGIDNDDFEFIELVNAGPFAVTLSGASLFEGIEFSFDPAVETLLEPGQRAVVVKDREAFELRYGTEIEIAGEFGGNLDNRGERLVLVDRLGLVVEDFAYDDNDPWPARSDGGGSSMQRMAGDGAAGDASSWRSSIEFDGSPAAAGLEPFYDVIINEVLTLGNAGQSDQIELLNISSSPIDVSGWYLSDSLSSLMQYALPPLSVLAPGEYLVVNSNQTGFGLNGNTGDSLYLMQGRNGRLVRFADHRDFEAADRGVSLGRWPNGDPAAVLFPMTSQTFEQTNSGPRTPAVAISEIHYHPAPLPSFQHDFNDGGAGDMAPVQGTWSVVDGQLQVVPVASEDTLATVPELPALSDHFKITADVTIIDNPSLNNNAVIYFDYKGPEDFKFASFHERNDRWRLGVRDANGWNFISEIEAPVDAGTKYAIEVEIFGSVAILRADGAIKTAHDYGTSLQGGLVGLGSRKSQTRFDNLTVTPLGDAQDYEFIEITNTTGAAVDLAGWKLDGDVDFQFPAGESLAGGESIVAVNFSPDDTARLAEFRKLFGVDPSVRFVGPFANRLVDDGGAVNLLRPVVPLSPGTGFVLVDRVAYDDQAPWPVGADGTGHSISRVPADAFGSLASNWLVGLPTPGENFMDAPEDGASGSGNSQFAAVDQLFEDLGRSD